jgi:carboxyl-terminal processing protease
MKIVPPQWNSVLIQDNEGTIVGRRSFGKGLVQREMDFDDGSAVRLTVARYYTRQVGSIQTL